MQILEQLSDRKFVVELDDYDFDRTREMHVAHDYVRFCSNEGLQAKSGVGIRVWIASRGYDFCYRNCKRKSRV